MESGEFLCKTVDGALVHGMRERVGSRPLGKKNTDTHDSGKNIKKWRDRRPFHKQRTTQNNKNQQKRENC